MSVEKTSKLLREHFAGACCRSKLPRVCRPLYSDKTWVFDQSEHAVLQANS